MACYYKSETIKWGYLKRMFEHWKRINLDSNITKHLGNSRSKDIHYQKIKYLGMQNWNRFGKITKNGRHKNNSRKEEETQITTTANINKTAEVNYRNESLEKITTTKPVQDSIETIHQLTP